MSLFSIPSISLNNSAVKKFLGWRQGDEDERWAEKAIESLIKKLKKKRGALEELEKALIQTGRTNCVTIKRSLDGRLQVSHRKGLPHVIYCRIWRWPDLQNHHELRSVDYCEYPYLGKHEDVCVNPYHYERVETSILPPVLVPRSSEFSSSSENHDLHHVQHPHQPPTFSLSYHNNQQPPQSTVSHPSVSSGSPSSMFTNHHQPYDLSSPTSILPINGTNTNTTTAGCNGGDSLNIGNGMNLMHDHSLVDNNGFYTNSNNNNANIHNFNNGSMSMFSNSPENYLNQRNSDSNFHHNNMALVPSVPSPTMSTVSSGFGPNSPNLRLVETPPPGFSPRDNGNCSSYDSPMMDIGESDMVPLEYRNSENWCKIFYYELNTRVGEVFLGRKSRNERNGVIQSEVCIDGFTHPSQLNRFCLGSLSNVNRNSTIEQTRRHIGNGVRLKHTNGEVWVKCCSESAVFVQSRNCNYSYGFNLQTVIKLPKDFELKVFDSKKFTQLLGQCVHQGYEAVFELTKMCTIRMSFVKGWGSDYHRQDITSTPCWVEIHLLDQLQWLDHVLTQLGPPHGQISSVS